MSSPFLPPTPSPLRLCHQLACSHLFFPQRRNRSRESPVRHRLYHKLVRRRGPGRREPDAAPEPGAQPLQPAPLRLPSRYGPLLTHIYTHSRDAYIANTGHRRPATAFPESTWWSPRRHAPGPSSYVSSLPPSLSILHPEIAVSCHTNSMYSPPRRSRRRRRPSHAALPPGRRQHAPSPEPAPRHALAPSAGPVPLPASRPRRRRRRSAPRVPGVPHAAHRAGLPSRCRASAWDGASSWRTARA